MNKVLDFWMKIWLYIMAAGGIILTILVVIFWFQFGWATRLVYITWIGLVLHVLEEWRFPGGFHYIYNLLQKSEIPDRYPMNQVSDMVTNFGALVVAFGGITLIQFIPDFIPIMAVSSFIFCFFEVLAHTLFIGFRTNKVFNTKGIKNIYNPGFLTSYIVFLPVSIGFIYIFASGILQPDLIHWLLGAVLMVTMAFLLIFLTERVLKNKNTPYPFTWKQGYGYYKKYID